MRGEFTDKLSVLGLAVGVLLVLVGLGTLMGTPWTTSETVLAGITQVVGAVLAIALGAGLAWLVRVDEPAA